MADLKAELALVKAQLLAGRAVELAGGVKILVEEVPGVDADSLKVSGRKLRRCCAHLNHRMACSFWRQPDF